MSKNIKAGYLGPKGSFSEEALLDFFNDDIIAIEYKHFEDIFSHLESKEITYGIFPVENSSTGGINEVSDLLMKYHFYIIGEKVLRVQQNLLAKEEVDFSSISKIYSISHAYNQSKSFIDEALPNAKLIPTSSTAESASIVSSLPTFDAACIASKRAAKLYHLKLLKENINNSKCNSTRFIVVSREMTIPNIPSIPMQNGSKPDKISMIFILPHISGSLYKALGCFANNHINLLRIESRPLPDTQWEYLFHADFTGNLKDNNVIAALSSLEQIGITYKILGIYYEERCTNDE